MIHTISYYPILSYVALPFLMLSCFILNYLISSYILEYYPMLSYFSLLHHILVPFYIIVPHFRKYLTSFQLPNIMLPSGPSRPYAMFEPISLQVFAKDFAIIGSDQKILQGTALILAYAGTCYQQRVLVLMLWPVAAYGLGKF